MAINRTIYGCIIKANSKHPGHITERITSITIRFLTCAMEIMKLTADGMSLTLEEFRLESLRKKNTKKYLRTSPGTFSNIFQELQQYMSSKYVHGNFNT